MSLLELKQRIEKKHAKVAVIGLGYVGLPVAASFAKCGFDVLGLDRLEDRVAKIISGVSPIEGNEPGLEAFIQEGIASGLLRASTSYADLHDREVILISVETPIDSNHRPQYEALKSVLFTLTKILRKGALVIVESTISPGTMNGLVRPFLERSGKKLGVDFYLGHCPERVMPGRLLENLRTLSRVVGGMSPETAETMVSLYRHIVSGELDMTDCVTAELVKTVENAYRDVQIAFANEIAIIAEGVGGDVWRVRELVNKSPGRNMLLPGAGVGGHCIPKDPWLLAYGHANASTLRLIPAAREVNDGMPAHVVDLLIERLKKHGKSINGSRILLLGFAYLEDSDDTRNSPSQAVTELLAAKGAEIVIHDPFVDGYKGDVMSMAKGCDAAALLVKHSEYAELDLARLRDLMNLPVLIDARGFYSSDVLNKAKLSYIQLGKKP